MAKRLKKITVTHKLSKEISPNLPASWSLTTSETYNHLFNEFILNNSYITHINRIVDILKIHLIQDKIKELVENKNHAHPKPKN